MRSIQAAKESMRTDPVYRPALVRFTFMAGLSSRRERFVTERGYLLCRQYLIERLLPKFLHTGEPFSPDVCLGLAKMAIAGFVGADRRRTLS